VARGAGITLRGRIQVRQLPMLPCRDTRTVRMTRAPGIASPIRKAAVQVPSALARPAPRSPLASASGPVAITQARATVLTRISTIVLTRGRLLLGWILQASRDTKVAGVVELGLGAGAV